MPRAVSLAATIKSQLGLETELVEGRGGLFEIYRDKTKIYSKKTTGKFPEDSFIIQALQKSGN